MSMHSIRDQDAAEAEKRAANADFRGPSFEAPYVAVEQLARFCRPIPHHLKAFAMSDPAAVGAFNLEMSNAA